MKHIRLLAGAGVMVVLAGCQPPSTQPVLPAETPSPTPAVTPVVATSTPSPTPLPVPALPRKPVELGRMFNGITFQTKFATPASDEPASVERTQDNAYEVQVTFTARLPRASRSLEDLAKNDPKLPHVLNQMPSLVENAKVSPFFEKLYSNKIESIRSQLFQLDEVLSRHNFYDCETMLEFTSPDTGRKALLLIGDMDVNVDGTDGDRNVQIDDSGRFFQPQTSYRWKRTTDRVNPLLPRYQQKLADLKREYAVPGLSAARNKDLQQAIDQTTRTINDLKTYSFLISSTDPSIVIPTFMINDKENPFAPKVGDYAAVIYNGVVYPAIVGDAGPSAKLGEASIRLAREINPKASSIARPVSNIKVAYLVFPGTADPATQPNLADWRAKCKAYLDELGGTAPELFTWTDIVPPWPTPTPTPTPEPSPSAAPSASPEGSPAAEASPAATVNPNFIIETPQPSATPAPSASPSPAASPSPTPTAPQPAVITPADAPAAPSNP